MFAAAAAESVAAAAAGEVVAAAAAERLADGRCQKRLQLAAAAAAETWAEAPSLAAQRQLERQQPAVALSHCCRKTKLKQISNSIPGCRKTKCATID